MVLCLNKRIIWEKNLMAAQGKLIQKGERLAGQITIFKTKPEPFSTWFWFVQGKNHFLKNTELQMFKNIYSSRHWKVVFVTEFVKAQWVTTKSQWWQKMQDLTLQPAGRVGPQLWLIFTCRSAYRVEVNKRSPCWFTDTSLWKGHSIIFFYIATFHISLSVCLIFLSFSLLPPPTHSHAHIHSLRIYIY